MLLGSVTPPFCYQPKAHQIMLMYAGIWPILFFLEPFFPHRGRGATSPEQERVVGYIRDLFCSDCTNRLSTLLFFVAFIAKTKVPQFSVFTWRHGSYVGVQNNSEKSILGIWFYYYAKLERHFAILLYTTMAVLSLEWKPRIISSSRGSTFNSHFWVPLPKSPVSKVWSHIKEELCSSEINVKMRISSSFVS